MQTSSPDFDHDIPLPWQQGEWVQLHAVDLVQAQELLDTLESRQISNIQIEPATEVAGFIILYPIFNRQVA